MSNSKIDKLKEIKERLADTNTVGMRQLHWLIAEVERLRQILNDCLKIIKENQDG